MKHPRQEWNCTKSQTLIVTICKACLGTGIHLALRQPWSTSVSPGKQILQAHRRPSLGDGEGRGSLACCSPRDCKESDTTERLNNSNHCRPTAGPRNGPPGDVVPRTQAYKHGTFQAHCWAGCVKVETPIHKPRFHILDPERPRSPG